VIDKEHERRATLEAKAIAPHGSIRDAALCAKEPNITPKSQT
jgi:hypothetical protein